MTIAFDVLLRIARQLDETAEGTATSGSTTTLVDTAQVEPDDYWNSGTLFILSGARANTTTVPSDWVLSTKTLTIPADGAKVIAAGNGYLLLKSKWPKMDLVRCLNTALGQQWIVEEDDTLTGDGSTPAYDLPTGVARVTRVMVGNETDGWARHMYWREENGELRFTAEIPSDTIRLYYLVKHDLIDGDADAIHDEIDLNLLHYDTLAELYRSKAYLTGSQNKEMKELFQLFKGEADRRRTSKINPDPRFGVW